VQRPTHTHGRGRDGIARDPRRCRPRAIQRARLVRRCCRARPFDLGNRLDARGGGGTRRDMGIVLDGRPVLAAFQRMPSRASRSLLRAGAQGKDGLFRCAARTTARLPGGGEKKKVRGRNLRARIGRSPCLEGSFVGYHYHQDTYDRSRSLSV
jgi:hypothetical protein